jgi:hypothetical protein
MSNTYPEHQGKYERTALTKVRSQLTWARKSLILTQHKIEELAAKEAELVQKESSSK